MSKLKKVAQYWHTKATIFKGLQSNSTLFAVKVKGWIIFITVWLAIAKG